MIEPSSVVSNAASILLDGAGANFYRDSGTTSALSDLAANTAAGSLAVQNGATLTTAAGFSNAGALTVGSGAAFLPTGALTQIGGSTSLQRGTLGRVLPPAGNDLTFDGVQQYVAVPNSPSLNVASQVTVEAWVRPDSLSSPEMGIAGAWDDVSGNNRTYLLWILNGKASLYVAHPGGGFANVNGVTALQVGTWYHIAGTFGGTSLKIYVNGTLEGTTSSPGAIATNSQPFFIGRQDTGGGSRYFAGAIDDVRVWGTARSASAIEANRGRALVGNETGLAGYWKLDEGSGTTTADSTANGNTGTLGAGVAANQPAWSVSAPFSVNLQGGTLTGSGTVNGEVVNAATLGPGTPTGTLAINGAYTQTSAGTLNVNLAGPTAGTLYDQVNVSGVAALDGTLNVTRLNGYLANRGDTFQVLTFASRAGQFAAINGLQLGNSAVLRANYSGSDVTLVGEGSGITLNPTFGLVTTQGGGGTATFTALLDSQPTADVTFGLTSSNTGAGTVSPNSLTFTAQNWNVPQTVTVTGVDDFIDEGDVAYTIMTSAATSADPRYNGLDPSDVAVVNKGSHTAGFTITPTTGLQTSQAGGTATFGVVLNSKPRADVTVALISGKRRRHRRAGAWPAPLGARAAPQPHAERRPRGPSDPDRRVPPQRARPRRPARGRVPGHAPRPQRSARPGCKASRAVATRRAPRLHAAIIGTWPPRPP